MKTTILVADRDTNITRLCEEALKARGYRVFSAHHGEEALEIAATEHPDVILLGIMIPGLSGINVLKMIRSDSKLKNTKVIVLTALDDNSTKKKVVKLGVSAYFVKSKVNLAEVISTVGGIV